MGTKQQSLRRFQTNHPRESCLNKRKQSDEEDLRWLDEMSDQLGAAGCVVAGSGCVGFCRPSLEVHAVCVPGCWSCYSMDAVVYPESKTQVFASRPFAQFLYPVGCESAESKMRVARRWIITRSLYQ